MSWRCRNRTNDGLVCMMGPGHPGDHQAVVLLHGHVALVWWKNDRADIVFSEDSGAGMVSEEISERRLSDRVAVLHETSAPEHPPRDRNFGKDIVGRRQTRATSHNLYAGTGDGIHTSWDLFGHEVLPLPTLDELEAA